MDRKDFTKKLALMGVCPFVATRLFGAENQAETIQKNEDINVIKAHKQFVENWLADLLESIEKNLDRETQEKLLAHCGVACFNKHQFKRDIAVNSEGSLDKLIENYKKNFEIWQDGDQVHIRYGEVSNQCYCPAANYRPAKLNDIHCECTRNTHKAIFDTALGKSFRVEIAESLRRGGKTCHFVVYLT